ncbi:flagellar biosynthesis protein FlaG [Pseudomonas sp. 02C 26]|jgi:flagellar protein FlaG|uniref:flagellar protein FlaG n=1 Tax=Pseudomonas sp. 02C 26 TaxID=2054914 RepID=UPI000C6EE074|nr:flagellar protein FlaG [Pseudomonas sp. 02C 26]AUF95589.1 flagellar biosynthesis protein FlaG [Pseudomonas sp. 02C 26]
MDMSVKLNLSYPAARPTEQVAEKPVSDVAVPRTEDGKRLSDGEQPSAVIDAEQVRSAVAEIEKFLSNGRRNLEFSTDEESGKVVVKVIASETGELIRQLPSEEALRIANSLSDANSLLFDAKA